MSRAYDGRCKTGYRVLWCDVIHSLVHSHRRFRNFLITLIKNKTSILGKDAESSSETSEYICRTRSVTLQGVSGGNWYNFLLEGTQNLPLPTNSATIERHKL
jgi:hypothetical protein